MESETDKSSGLVICESCGNKFGCGASLGECWCKSVVLDEAAASALKATFVACLCPDCLATHAAVVIK